MRRPRQVLAIVVVATALFADRGLAAPASARPEPPPRPIGSIAGRFFNKLSRNLSRPVPVALCRQTRPTPADASLTRAGSGDQSLGLPHGPLSLLECRLPPPVV